jgi:hypothetical protein
MSSRTFLIATLFLVSCGGPASILQSADMPASPKPILLTITLDADEEETADAVTTKASFVFDGIVESHFPLPDVQGALRFVDTASYKQIEDGEVLGIFSAWWGDTGHEFQIIKYPNRDSISLMHLSGIEGTECQPAEEIATILVPRTADVRIVGVDDPLPSGLTWCMYSMAR